MADIEYTVDYHTHFDSQWYLDTYCTSISDDEDNCFIAFYINRYCDIFQSGNVKGRYLLDVGTGPTIHSIISASRHVDEIYLSDFTPQNRAVLTDWWKGNGTVQDKITEYILKKESANESVLDRQKMMKSKVQGVLPIDIRSPYPIRSECHVKEFDVITSSLCMESASHSNEEYRRNVKNMTSLLKTGGHLVLSGAFEGTFYRVGKFRFDCLSLTRNHLEAVFVESGFVIMDFYEREKGEHMREHQHDGTISFVMYAKKVK